MVTLNEIFESPKIKEIGNKEIVQTKDFSNLQKKAIIKAVLYIISADNIITEEEKTFLYQLCSELDANNNIIKQAIDLSDEEMFETLKSVTDEQEVYIMACLNKAAYADLSLANEEENLIEIFSKHIQSGEKPIDFYNKILTF